MLLTGRARTDRCIVERRIGGQRELALSGLSGAADVTGCIVGAAPAGYSRLELPSASAIRRRSSAGASSRQRVAIDPADLDLEVEALRARRAFVEMPSDRLALPDRQLTIEIVVDAAYRAIAIHLPRIPRPIPLKKNHSGRDHVPRPDPTTASGAAFFPGAAGSSPCRSGRP